MKVLHFTVEGTPQPQGSITRNRYGAAYSDNPQLKPWRAAVTTAAKEEMERIGWDALDEACVLYAVYYLPRGSSVKRKLPTVKPDRDKLDRAIADSLTDAGAIVDDNRIVSGSSIKLYADEHAPGAVVTLSRYCDVYEAEGA